MVSRHVWYTLAWHLVSLTYVLSNFAPKIFSLNFLKEKSRDILVFSVIGTGELVSVFASFISTSNESNTLLTVFSYHVTYAYYSEFTLCSHLDIKEPLTWYRCNIWNLSDCNGNRTHNHIVRKWTLNQLAKLTIWLSCVVSNYLYGAFDSVFFVMSHGCGFESLCSHSKSLKFAESCVSRFESFIVRLFLIGF